jgi:hypothetical protein
MYGAHWRFIRLKIAIYPTIIGSTSVQLRYESHALHEQYDTTLYRRNLSEDRGGIIAERNKILS